MSRTLLNSSQACRLFHYLTRRQTRWTSGRTDGEFDRWDTHLTPKRSMNMMWFLKVLLMSRSICLISDEYSRACAFIF